MVKAASTTSSSLCLGWSKFPVFSSPQKLSLAISEGVVRTPIYDGSPRVLFTMQRTVGNAKHCCTQIRCIAIIFLDVCLILDNSHLTSVPGCMLSLSFAKHPTLFRAIHLIPEDTLVSFEDIIPGTVHTLIPEAFPKMGKTQSLLIEKVKLA